MASRSMNDGEDNNAKMTILEMVLSLMALGH